MRTLLQCFIVAATSLSFACPTAARPASPAHELSETAVEIDVVGNVEGAAAQKILQDTIWIASWSFDTGTPCDDTGWIKVDNRILNDGAVYWHIESNFAGTGGIVGQAAAVGYHGNHCCVQHGYDGDW